ncbi:MAG: adenylosuccinate lyase, partial [Candidatus Acetothermia bacterium]
MPTDKSDITTITGISPIDGRYKERVDELAEHLSEYALHRERVFVEIEYLLSLNELLGREKQIQETPLREIYRSFDVKDAQLIRRIEREGHEDIPATNHDVKAVEYFLRRELEKRNCSSLTPLLHFGLTSEDVNNLAYSRMVRKGWRKSLMFQLRSLIEELMNKADANKTTPMLGRTHGQPASPTTVGKEWSVYLVRTASTAEAVANADRRLTGKLCGATGNLNAHLAAYPQLDWLQFSKEFVSALDLKPNLSVTQVEPGDNLARLFHGLIRLNNVLIDLARDTWFYISLGYFKQKKEKGEVGSSTMPHKLNPIDFENAEGNLSKANSDLHFIADYITKSRLQRDLSNSTVMRNIGSAFAHCLLAYKKLNKGLEKVLVDEQRVKRDLNDHPEVVTEGWQTILRKSGFKEAYETVKDKSRGKAPGHKDEILAEISDELSLSEGEEERLRALSPT